MLWFGSGRTVMFPQKWPSGFDAVTAASPSNEGKENFVTLSLVSTQKWQGEVPVTCGDHSWGTLGWTFLLSFLVRFIVLSNNYLQIRGIKKTDEGTYRCEGRILARGEINFKDIQVIVNGEHLRVRLLCGQRMQHLHARLSMEMLF